MACHTTIQYLRTEKQLTNYNYDHDVTLVFKYDRLTKKKRERKLTFVQFQLDLRFQHLFRNFSVNNSISVKLLFSMSDWSFILN